MWATLQPCYKFTIFLVGFIDERELISEFMYKVMNHKLLSPVFTWPWVKKTSLSFSFPAVIPGLNQFS